MYQAEQQSLIYIIRQLPKMHISFERIERDLHFITAATLYNYASGRTKPKKKKFQFLVNALREKYPYEYDCAKANFERENGKTIKEMIEEELRSYIIIWGNKWVIIQTKEGISVMLIAV